MITCDLCGKAKECLQKEIDSKEYDICSECWDALAQRLKGKGRVKPREMVSAGFARKNLHRLITRGGSLATRKDCVLERGHLGTAASCPSLFPV